MRSCIGDSNSDACRIGIVDIICMATDVICIIWEDYRIPHVEHGGDRSPLSRQLLDHHLFEGRSTSRRRDPPLVQPPTSLDLPPLQPPTSSDPPSVQIDTSTQLDLPPSISRGRRGLRRPRLLPPPPPLFPAPAPSQIDVHHVSHAVPATVREEHPKSKRVPVTHRFSPCVGM
ncbi:hypothetical protein CK203_000337 [Vitis vinifera]|uniref:Uncharacterized protein n=1 Tax=Vitis vinifera TaxID=29760 RepID=A0A438KRF9_VITVI|nr:hypothetical protein CK203_000337 [Vitis vinifera]